MIRALFALTLVSCGLQDIGGGAGLYLGTGEVFQCEQNGEIAEWCWMDDDAGEFADALAEQYGPDAICWPTHRHSGPCVYGCAGAALHFCNAKNGCFCP